MFREGELEPIEFVPEVEARDDAAKKPMVDLGKCDECDSQHSVAVGFTNKESSVPIIERRHDFELLPVSRRVGLSPNVSSVRETVEHSVVGPSERVRRVDRRCGIGRVNRPNVGAVHSVLSFARVNRLREPRGRRPSRSGTRANAGCRGSSLGVCAEQASRQADGERVVALPVIEQPAVMAEGVTRIAVSPSQRVVDLGNSVKFAASLSVPFSPEFVEHRAAEFAARFERLCAELLRAMADEELLKAFVVDVLPNQSVHKERQAVRRAVIVNPSETARGVFVVAERLLKRIRLLEPLMRWRRIVESVECMEEVAQEGVAEID